jgi:O-acetylserine/cysteine efflux transporter
LKTHRNYNTYGPFHLLGKYAVNPVVTLTLAAPAIAVLMAAWILDEPLTVRVLLGSAATLVGVAVIQLYPGRTAT